MHYANGYVVFCLIVLSVRLEYRQEYKHCYRLIYDLIQISTSIIVVNSRFVVTCIPLNICKTCLTLKKIQRETRTYGQTDRLSFSYRCIVTTVKWLAGDRSLVADRKKAAEAIAWRNKRNNRISEDHFRFPSRRARTSPATRRLSGSAVLEESIPPAETLSQSACPNNTAVETLPPPDETLPPSRLLQQLAGRNTTNIPPCPNNNTPINILFTLDEIEITLSNVKSEIFGNKPSSWYLPRGLSSVAGLRSAAQHRRIRRIRFLGGSPNWG